MDKKTLEGGLSIISLCKSSTGDIWEAHIGAGAIASVFFIKENGMSAETVNRITAQSEAMLNKYLIKRTADVAAGIEHRDAEHMILEALEISIDQLHWVGHNVIYAALSLLALRELGRWGSQGEIEGICALLRSFEKTIPGRSWLDYTASEVKKLQLEESDNIPAIEDAKQLSEFVLNEVSSFRTIYRAESHHDLIGHMLTFSHALNILFDLGHVTYFKRGLSPFLKLAKVLRVSHDLDLDLDLNPDHPIKLSSPVDRWPIIKAERSEWLPVDHEYWSKDYAQHDWDFGHVFKFPFSFYNQLNRVSRRNDSASENFRYIVHSPNFHL